MGELKINKNENNSKLSLSNKKNEFENEDDIKIDTNIK